MISKNDSRMNFYLENFDCQDDRVADILVCVPEQGTSVVKNYDECKKECENQLTCKAFDFDEGRSTKGKNLTEQEKKLKKN